MPDAPRRCSGGTGKHGAPQHAINHHTTNDRGEGLARNYARLTCSDVPAIAAIT